MTTDVLDPAQRKQAAQRIRAAIRDVPDFPKPGILFRDLTTVMVDAELHALALQVQLSAVGELKGQIDRVVGIESRGYWFGPMLAHALDVGFVPMRKPGKLPAETVSRSYGLEYGEDTLHVHKDAIGEGHRVVVVDDLLATGGTASAACELVEQCGGQVAACLFLVELAALGGRAKLGERRCEAIVVYD